MSLAGAAQALAAAGAMGSDGERAAAGRRRNGRVVARID